MVNKVLLTGGSGKLGNEITKSNLFDNILYPTRKEMDITNPSSITKYFDEHDFNIIIHTAAIAKMITCEENQNLAIQTNIIGTSNLVNEIFSRNLESKVRFIHISTDGVYQGTKGNYSEIDPTIPYNIYGWTKLGAECSVKTLPNHCIIRTRFFDTYDKRFKDYPSDLFTSKIPINDLVKAIHFLSYSDFIGILNVGDKRMSEYDRHKIYQPNAISTSYEYVQKLSKIKLAQDASMDISLWERLKNEK